MDDMGVKAYDEVFHLGRSLIPTWFARGVYKKHPHMLSDPNKWSRNVLYPARSTQKAETAGGRVLLTTGFLQD